VVICTATAVVLANLIVDILYAFLDPRVRFA
jgi:ABC-type dipeptide/oligopeptide/nickel transport system permease component